jgi:hypothetical protein
MRRLLQAAAVAGAALIVAAAPAMAKPDQPAPQWYWWYCPGGSLNVPFYGECNGPNVDAAGDHWHCFSAPFVSRCGWVNAANQPIPAPPGFF